MRHTIVWTLALIVLPLTIAAQKYPFQNPSLPIEERVEDLLSRMTLDEKIAIIHAQSKFSSPGVPRLGVPELWCTDGPHGIRPEVKWDEWDQAGWTNDSIVAFPALTCLAATWSEEMARLYGISIGEEARFRKKDVLLGPGLNIYRTPLGGRNFEYMGEDPYLASRMAVQYVRGVQSNGVATCVKHFCLNNQELNRHGVNVHVDDRALYEIYLPAFKAAVTEGDSWSLMGAYNLIDGQYACHNKRLLQDILKGEWGWQGAVISDWGGTHYTDQAVTNGLDLEFGTGTNGLSGRAKKSYDNYHLALPFLEGIESGKYNLADLNEKVRRVLRLHMHTTLNTNKPFGCINSEEHYAAARQIGAEGIVLLKNEGKLLPLKAEGKTILVVGENAVKMMTVGGGSSSLKVQREITPLEGLTSRFSDNATIKWVRGYVGDPSGSYNGVTTGQDLNDKRPFRQLVDEAVSEARKADYVIFIGGLNKSGYQDCEGVDRKHYNLPYNQDSLITELAHANHNLVVVNISGNAVEMPWVNDVPAILQDWYIGSQAGPALADIISGDICPSGKLPFSWPAKLEDAPAHQLAAYTDRDETYKESIFVGYRWHDMATDNTTANTKTKQAKKNTKQNKQATNSQNKQVATYTNKQVATSTNKQKENFPYDQTPRKPLFPFGHGLSYTTFEYSDATADKSVITASDSITITLTVKNTGTITGKEAVQLYISDLESTLPRPIKELKGFRKISLAPGESQAISFTLNRDALSYFNPTLHKWVAEPGQFEAIIASSSQDIRARVTFSLK